MFKGRSNKARTLISAGFEGPFLYNFFYNAREPIPAILKKFNFAFNYHFFDIYTKEEDPDFAKDIKMSWIVKFSLF